MEHLLIRGAAAIALTSRVLAIFAVALVSASSASAYIYHRHYRGVPYQRVDRAWERRAALPKSGSFDYVFCGSGPNSNCRPDKFTDGRWVVGQ